MKFAQFMSSWVGRLVRIAVGVALIWWGLSMHSTAGYIIAIVGVVPTIAGLFNFCVVGPLIGVSFWGKDLNKNSAPSMSTSDSNNTAQS